jgi:hypothetical protein
MAEAWAPALDDVARHVLGRTRDTKTPGSDAVLGTFTEHTTPTAGQAQAVIDAAVLGILSQTGALDRADRDLLDQARVAAEWRAAADIELMDPNRDADVAVYAQLDARAKYEMTLLLARLSGLGEGPAEALPTWSAPDPPPWADRDPGDYTRPLGPWYWGGADRLR